MRKQTVFRGLLSISLAAALFLLLPKSTTANDYRLYFGLLHAHTEISGAQGSVEETFSAAAAVEGLDFFAVTDYSTSFDNAEAGSIGIDGTAVSTSWAAGKAAAAAVTGEDFVGIFGYEMSFRDDFHYGHMATFGTPGWISRNQEGFADLTDYYDALTTVPGSVSQFNHPGADQGDFQSFSHWTEGYDDAVSLLEIGEKGGYRSYLKALDAGWHVAPTLSQNNHHGNFGTENDVRTVVLAESLSEESLYEAMRSRRVYATEDKDLEISYTLNGAVMGSVLPFAQTLTLCVSVQDVTDGSDAVVEVITGGGAVAATGNPENGTVTLSLPGVSGYYFLRITQADGDTAITAPVWIEEEPEEPPSEPTEPSTEPETHPEEDFLFPEDLDVTLYRGLLHAHTEISGSKGTVAEAFAAASTLESMDFFAVTDHSNSFDNDTLGSISGDGSSISAQWAAGKTAAKEYTTDQFLALFGYEMTWPDDRNLGHINTFGTPGWVSRNQEGFDALKPYYEALTTVSASVSQFNHPGPDLGDFEQFSHRSAKYDNALSLLEVGDGNGWNEKAYTAALDAGWHVSPTASHNDHEGLFGSGSEVRTVVLAAELTEASLLAAMANRRTYATEDIDLSLYYTLDDALMGSLVPAQETHTLHLMMADPTDTGTVTVDVISDGGKSVNSVTLGQNAEVTLSLTGGGSYYYLRITQADGDVAITAPVWTETYENVGITSLDADTAVPIPGQNVTLTATVFNEESAEFVLESAELYSGETRVYRKQSPGTVFPADTLTLSIPYTQSQAGEVVLRLKITGTVENVTHVLEEELTLRFRAREMVKGILIDLGHSSHSPRDFDNLTVLAEEANLSIQYFTGNLPEDGSILILPGADRDYEPDFLQQVKIFCARGGTLVVCGSADTGSRQNTLLQTIGSSLRLQEDTAIDPVHNGGEEDELYPTDFNRDIFWCETITKDQVYVHRKGSTVDPGKGDWLVKGADTTRSNLTGETSPALLAWEKLASGNHVLAAGSLFLQDQDTELPESRWDTPTANQTIVETLMGITRSEFPVIQICDVRNGDASTLYHIRGYTTSGTSNKFNTFPETIYLQDDSGGIAVTPFREDGVPVGVQMDVVGYLKKDEQGNLYILPVDHQLREDNLYRYVPKTLNHSRAMNYRERGGQLIQIEATVTSMTLTEDSLGISRLTLTDSWGDKATILVEDYIRSGAYGTNTLANRPHCPGHGPSASGQQRHSGTSGAQLRRSGMGTSHSPSRRQSLYRRFHRLCRCNRYHQSGIAGSDSETA